MSSGFESQGFDSYPDLHLDREAAHNVTEWPDSHLNDKIAQYREFSRRERIMPRHREQADQIQGWLEFEGDARDGIFEFIGEVATADISKLEDETNECA